MSFLLLDDAIRLTSAKKVGSVWQGTCPTHNDENPSLSISPSKDDSTKAVVYCQSSCGTKAPYKELMKRNGKAVEIGREHYIYKNNASLESLRVTRLDYGNGQKKFFQENYRNKKWEKGGSEEQLCPYLYHEWKDSLEIIFLVEGEKCVNFLKGIGLVATTTPKGSNGWKSEYSVYFKDKDVVILPDRDDAGEVYAKKVYEDLKPIVKSIKFLRLPELKKGEDVVDWFTIGHTKDGFLELIEKCSNSIADNTEVDKVPLYRKPTEAENFPVHALGPQIVKVVAELQQVIQAPIAISAQSVLASVNLAIQGHYDITIDGRIYPLTLFFVSSAKSGERKSSSDAEVTKAHKKHQENLMEFYKEEFKRYKIKSLAYETAKKKITTQTKGKTKEILENELTELGDEPMPPLSPLLFIEDLTMEGLFKTLENSNPCLGIFSDEGGQLLGGYSFNQENARKTAAALSKLWDASPMSRSRAGDGNSYLIGRRVAMHLMIQPEMCSDLLSNAAFKDQGILNRILFSWPTSKIGDRPYVCKSLNDSAVMKDFWERISVFLRRPLPIKENSLNVLNPPKITLSCEAYQMWRSFYDKIEHSCNPGNENDQIFTYATRIPEQALRIAGTLTVFNHDSNVINALDMQNAIEIAEYYLREFKRISEGALVEQTLLLAEKLLSFIESRGYSEFCLADITQFGPNSIRVRSKALEILNILVDHGYLIKLPDSTLVDGKKRKDAWRVL